MKPSCDCINSRGFGAAVLTARIDSYPWISCRSGRAPATVNVVRGCVKTQSDLVVMPRGARISAFFCCPRDHTQDRTTAPNHYGGWRRRAFDPGPSYFTTSRAHSMKRSTTGVKVRCRSVTITTATVGQAIPTTTPSMRIDGHRGSKPNAGTP